LRRRGRSSLVTFISVGIGIGIGIAHRATYRSLLRSMSSSPRPSVPLRMVLRRSRSLRGLVRVF
jgi:hypothetical protein